ncbi:hypothetical protein QYE76_016084 [Lolium multiflorum]|uniref:Malectin-like domain-containing protein n=1 Tax=Lolium multiflorum TaxID=4521 RepID=A0AAD8U845_LOLMU|nr:hypothetical protein QYE76_016084 [Lolium multiflorum]
MTALLDSPIERAKKQKKSPSGQQDNQAIPHFVVQPYDDPEMIERAARAQGASIEYEDYYPTAQVVNKYRYGKDLVKPGELARLGTQMRRLHDWYLKACRRGDRYLTVYLRDEHYFRGVEEINLELEELFQLFNQDTLDKAVIISCYCLMKKLECKRGKLLPLGFIDPDTVHEVTVRDFAKDTEDNMVMFLVKQENKEEIFFPYNFKFHFILLIIDLHKGVVKVMDSKHKEYAEWADMAVILQRAWKRFITTGKWKSELTFEDYPLIEHLTMAATPWLLLLCVAAAAGGVLQALAQPDSKGYITIDCGLERKTGRVDNDTKLAYAPDNGEFTDGAGTSHNISAQYMSPSMHESWYNVRNFAGAGGRNCYTLRSLVPGLKYLVRASFMYGNYDGLNRPPVFDLHLGVNYFYTVSISRPDEAKFVEVIAVVPDDFVHVCLINTGAGTPFISG